MAGNRKRIIVFGYYGYRNLGDEEILRMICRDLGDRYGLTVLSRRPKETAALYGVNSIGRFHILQILSQIRHADLVIGGGGTLLQDKTSTRSLLYYLVILMTTQYFGIPTMLYAGGIGPIDRTPNRRRTAKVLRNVDVISLRDADSEKLLEDICPGKMAVSVADPVFCMEISHPDTVKRIAENYCISGKDLLAVSVRKMKKAEAKTMALLLDRIASEYGFIPVFLCMQEPGDRLASEQVRQLMTQESVLIREHLSGPEMTAFLRGTKGIIGLRMHALLFGAVAGIPLAGFDTDPKIIGFLKSVEFPVVIPWGNFIPEEAAQRVAEAFRSGRRPEISTAVRLSQITSRIVDTLLCEDRRPFFIHITSGGDYGGAKTHILSLLRGLMKKHCRVLLVCFVDGEFSQDAERVNIPVKILPRNDLLHNLIWLRRYIERNQVDAVHCHGAKGNMYGALLADSGAPVLTTVHSDPRLDYMDRPVADYIYGAINRRAIRRIGWCVCVSGTIRDYLLSTGIQKDRLFLLHNAAPDRKNEVFSRDAWLQKYGICTDKDAVVFGTASRFTPIKDLQTLIEAFAEVVRRFPSARLVIAGKGEEEEMLKEKARVLCPPGTVFFTGWLTDTGSFYRAVDVNVLTSLSEGFPYAIAEGGYAGCATIASRVGEVPRIIRDGREGLLFEPGDVRALTGYMESLIQDPVTRIKLGESLSRRIREDYSWQNMVDSQMEIYEKIRHN